MNRNQNFPDVSCHQCVCPGRDVITGRLVQMSRPMDLLHQFQVKGVHTYELHCGGCSGKAHIQRLKNPHTGQAQMVHVRLTGSDEEFRPNSIRPGEQVQIPVAYTLGHSPSSQASHIPAPPIQTPVPSIQLDPRIGRDAMIPPGHPMHPNSLRARMRPVRLNELTGRR